MRLSSYHRVLVALFLGAMLSASPLVFSPSTALGRTTIDSGYQFDMGDQKTWATEGRPKENASPTYIRVGTKTMYTCRVYVDAETPFGWKNETVYGYATVKRLGKFAIHQNVYENHGRCNARLSAWANNGGGELAGEWSPDSWGSYQSINGS